MTTSPTLSESDRVAASAVYDLGAAVARFRYYAEVNYVSGGDEDDLDDSAPEIISTSFRDVVVSAHRVADAVPAVKEDADALIAAAQARRDVVLQIWLKDDHVKRLGRREKAAAVGETRTSYVAWRVLFESPLASSMWADYQAAADRLQEHLSEPSGSVLRLSRLLTGVGYPLPSNYDPGLDEIPAFNDDHVVSVVGPQITNLLRKIQKVTGLLEDANGWLEGRDSRASAIRLDESVRLALAGDRAERTGEDVPQAAVTSLAPLTVQPLPLVPADSAAVTAVATDDASEEVDAGLLRLKKRMDPDDTYIGRSLAILKMFREMDRLNGLSDDPVMILGPTGVGKTRLARLLHDTSARKEGPFLDLSADDLVGGDETIRRVRWAGHGRNSGLSGVDPKQSVEGWLQKTKGGTIFVDEFHNLDETSLNYLRKPLDGDREIPPAVGEGEPFKPDVRLIFATYRTIEDLRREKKIPGDVFRRLRNRFLSVPPLRERKEDIPLFVEKFRGNCRPGECFYLALLYHDWAQGQVDELITTIRTAVANKDNRGTLRASDLRRLIPDEVIDRVAGMTEADVGWKLYTCLTDILEDQGFRSRGRRGVALQKRLAELLGISEARVSTRRNELGLRSSAETPDS